MHVRVNGEAREVADGTTIAALLVLLDLKAPRVAVELNAQVVTRARHADVTLKPGDEIEIVTFVGGG